MLFAEFGAATRDGDPEAESGPSPLLTENEAGRYTERAFARMHAAGAVGGVVWCYSDYDRTIWSEPPLDRAPHERHFGLWRADATRTEFYRSPRESLVRLYRAYTATSLARPVL